jgi:hypothetical protein
MPTMLIDWKVDSLIKALIAYRQSQRKPTRVTGSTSNCGSGISSNANIEPATQALLARWELVSQRSRIAESNRSVERSVHEVEGTQEIQKMLLRRLAEQENAVNSLGCKWPKDPRWSENGRFKMGIFTRVIHSYIKGWTRAMEKGYDIGTSYGLEWEMSLYIPYIICMILYIVSTSNMINVRDAHSGCRCQFGLSNMKRTMATIGTSLAGTRVVNLLKYYATQNLGQIQFGHQICPHPCNFVLVRQRMWNTKFAYTIP